MTPHTYCLLLTPADDTNSDSLRVQLSERRWHVVTVHDPYRAMAELCLREKAQSARLGWGLGRGQSMALVINQPGRWSAADALLRAMRTHLPNVALWTMEKDRLTQIEPGESAQNQISSHEQPNANAAGPTSDTGGTSGSNKHHSQRTSAVDDVPRPAPVRNATPQLRLTEAMEPKAIDHDQAIEDEAEESPAETSNLSAEEIHMLLTEPADSDRSGS